MAVLQALSRQAFWEAQHEGGAVTSTANRLTTEQIVECITDESTKQPWWIVLEIHTDAMRMHLATGDPELSALPDQRELDYYAVPVTARRDEHSSLQTVMVHVKEFSGLPIVDGTIPDFPAPHYD
jgi:hypothetical protein